MAKPVRQIEMFADDADTFPSPMKVNPIIRFPGKKTWAIPLIGPGIWGRLQRSRGRYIEPFFGGGAIGLWLGLPQMLIADASEPLIEMYTEVARAPGAVAWALSAFATKGVDEASYYHVRDSRPRSPAQRAARCLYMSALNFNGLWRVNKRGAFNVPYDTSPYRKSVIARKSRDAVTSLFPHKGKIEAVARALSTSTIRCSDFEPIIDTAKAGDVVCADPPYYDGFASYTPEGFSETDQIRLAECLRRAVDRGVIVVAFNKACDEVRSWYASFLTCYTTAESRAINSDKRGRGRVGCLLMTNADGLIRGV